MNADDIIEIHNLSTRFGDACIHQDLNLTIKRGEILGIVGGSGSGKTTLLRAMLGLAKPCSGTIKVFGHHLYSSSAKTLLEIQRRFGVLFQQNALFSSLTLLQNVAFPLREHVSIDEKSIEQLALLKIILAGLPIEAANKYPAELSGGMQKRAGLARAIVLDPELLFLDEPTAGLDPNTAAGFDELVLNLQGTMGLTVVMVTHDLDSLWKITNRVAFLGEKKVLCVDEIAKLVKHHHPLIKDFFHGARGRVVQENYGGK